ncbi:MAG: CapA family protein [Lachnospiraceae bacterium]|nr:CapA family protein [Lachnospiraceae bacterium]
MKKKIKADGVDELFEIVKAIQNGEEPEAYVKRKAAEEKAALLAAQKAAEEEKAAQKAAAEREKAAAKAAQKAAAKERAAARAAQKAATKEAAATQTEEDAVEGAGREKGRSSMSGMEKDIRDQQEDPFERQLDEEWDEGSEDVAENLKEYLKEAGAFIRKTAQFAGEKGKAVKGRAAATLSSVSEKKKKHPKTDRETTAVHPDAKEQVETAERTRPEKEEEPGGRIRPEERGEFPPQAYPEQRGSVPETKREPREKWTSQAVDDFSAEPVHSLGRVRLADTEKETKEGQKTRRRYGAKSVSEEAESVGRRILRSLHMDPAQDSTAGDQPEASRKKFSDDQKKKHSGDQQSSSRNKSPEAQADESMDLDALQIIDRLLEPRAPEESTTIPAAEAPGSITSGAPASSGMGSTGSTPAAGVSTDGAAAASAPVAVSNTSAASGTAASGSSAPGKAALSSSASTASAPIAGVTAESTASAPDTGMAAASASGTGTAAAAALDTGIAAVAAAGTMTATASVLNAGTATVSASDAGTAEGLAAGTGTAAVAVSDVVTVAASAAGTGTTAPTSGTMTAAAPASDTAASESPVPGIAVSSSMDDRTGTVPTAGSPADGTEKGTKDLSGASSENGEEKHLPDLREGLGRLRSALTGNGEKSGSRRSVAVGVGALAALLILVLLFGAVNHMLTQQKKRKYVTSDAGLDILVENQPDEWCSSCELQLKVSVKKGTISSVEVGGTSYEPDEKGNVTVMAEDYLLDAVIETDEGTLTATIEIPMLDADAPVLTAEKSGGNIVLTASDARSGVKKIWYAVLDDDDWLGLPLYQEYSEPFAFEEDKTYYFYAGDQAGNYSTVLVTNMETAQSISLSDTELTLFEGETAALLAEVNPSGALYSGLSYESSNTDVVTVSASGLIMAVGEGGALIKVSADSLETASCSVNVVTEQTVTISAIGDCTLGTYAGAVTSTSFDTYYSMYGASYFFENVREILQNDDFTFANLEGTLTDETTPVEKTYAFKGDPSYTEILLDGSIEVVTLANNHSSDYGAQSLVDTKENLAEAGIEYCIGDTIAYEEISGIKVAFIGIYELSTGMDCESQVRSTIAEAQSEGAALIIIAFHWGTEKETEADATQQSLAHIAIDCGADLVVGHHPHVLQGIEKYNGKYIVYSLGNFCFGGNSNPSDKDTMIFRQTFTITSDGVSEDDDIEIIPCTLSSASGYNDYRPTPATGSAADEIMERINEYSAAFGDITYTASTGL